MKLTFDPAKGTTPEKLKQEWRDKDIRDSKAQLGTATSRYRSRRGPASPTPLFTVNGKPLDIGNEIKHGTNQLLKIFGIK